MKTGSNTANGIISNTMKQKHSKAIDMRFYWLRDRAQQGQFNIYWDSGKHNLGDYYTKHHPPTHHKQVRPIYTFIEGASPETLQGCIEIMAGRAEPRREEKKGTPARPPKGFP